MNRKIFIRALFFCFIFLLIFMVQGQLALAAKWADTPSGLDLLIIDVSTDFSVTPALMTIYGQNFDNGDYPAVNLGHYNLTVNSYTAEMIIAELPVGIPDGDYRLTITTGVAVINFDSYDLTIGAVGPPGPAGPQGPEGPVGPQGPPGPQGEQGINCWDLNGNGQCDITEEDKNNDTLCDVHDCIGPQGPEGPQGAEGPVGPQGPEGPVGPQGPLGPQGEQGISCWDLNGNGQCDTAEEDKNNDTLCDVHDCIGPQGPEGPQGAEGPVGPQGPEGPVGPQGQPGEGVPPGFYILGETETAPPGYTYTGQIISPEPWVIKGPMQTEREWFAAATVNGKIYVFGGHCAGVGILATTEEYDPTTNTWATKADMPTARRMLTCATVGGKVYVIGGWLSYSGETTANEEYDPATNTWATKADMPTARCRSACATVNGKIYVFGGHPSGPPASSPPLATNEEYNPATNTWATKADMPTARDRFACATVNGKIYVLGGTSSDGFVGDINEEYDPLTNSWSSRAIMKGGRIDLGATALNGKVYALGGAFYVHRLYEGWGPTMFRDFEEYDPVTDSWTYKPNMANQCRDNIALTVSGKIYNLGCGIVKEYDPGRETYFYIHRKD